jgi:uncharacterized protein
MLPRILKAFTVSVDGRGYIGRVETCKLPDLTVKTEEYKGGGMDAPVDLDMGMEKLDVSITFAEYDPNLIKLFGLFSASTPLVLSGAMQRQGEEAVPVQVRLQGGVKQLGRSDWKQGEKGDLTISVNCNRYVEIIAGETVVEIDLLNYTRVIGGVDQLASIRAALGV